MGTICPRVMFKCQACNFEDESKGKLKKHIDKVHESIEVVLGCHLTKISKSNFKFFPFNILLAEFRYGEDGLEMLKL